MLSTRLFVVSLLLLLVSVAVHIASVRADADHAPPITSPNNPNNPNYPKRRPAPEHNVARHGTDRVVTPFGVIVDNGLVQIGVAGCGRLNVDDFDLVFPDVRGDQFVGLRYHLGDPLYNDAVSPAFPGEGWGIEAVFADSSIETAHDNTGAGSSDAFLPPAQVGTNGVDASCVAGRVAVSHIFRPSNDTQHLYEILVTLTNVGAVNILRLRYGRTMDWDIFDTTFDECVDLNLGNNTDARCGFTNGFIDGTPSDVNFQDANIFFPGAFAGPCFTGGAGIRSFEKAGPFDHGAAFQFEFGDITPSTPLRPGQSKSFKLFYGAADNKAQAFGVLASVGAEAYSLGYPHDANHSCDGDGSPNTYIFAYADIASTPCEGCDTLHLCPERAGSIVSTTTCAVIDFTVDACP